MEKQRETELKTCEILKLRGSADADKDQDPQYEYRTTLEQSEKDAAVFCRDKEWTANMICFQTMESKPMPRLI